MNMPTSAPITTTTTATTILPAVVTTLSAVAVTPLPATTTTITTDTATMHETESIGGHAIGVAGNAVAAAHNGREARNLAEKHRRDKLNASIHELSTMVPHVAEATRRLDKTAVLRFAAHGLRLQYVFGKSTMRKRKHCGSGSDSGDVDVDGSMTQQQQQQQPELTDALMQLLDSFFITLTCHGQIVLVSASIEQLLGHCQSDLYGQNILQITHPADQELMRQQLIPRDMDTLFRHDYRHNVTQMVHDDDDDDEDDHLHDNDHDQDDHNDHENYDDEEDDDNDDDDDDNDDDVDNDHDDDEQHNANSNFYRQRARSRRRRRRRDHHQHRHPSSHHRHRTPSPRTQTYLHEIDRRLRADRRCFTVRLARAGTRSEAQRNYEIVKIDGCFRRSDCSSAAGSFPIVSQLIRRSRSTTGGGVGAAAAAHLLEHDIIAQAALHGVSGNDIVLVALARIIRPPKIWNRIFDPNQLEYKTRHLIDGRIVDCDQRIGLVAGYMREEVHNLSPFSFIHLDDVRWVIVALRQMYDCNSNYGESCYRLITRNGHFIYLQTKGYLEVDKNTNKVHSFLCVNTLLSEEEGRRKVQEMKDKFSVIIKTKIPSNNMEDVPASQNPQQLERIVLYLIENLQKRNEDVSNGYSTNAATINGNAATMPGVTITNMGQTSPNGQLNSRGDQLRRQTKTPPLSLVPPPTATVKNSISKSVNVVNVTAAKNLLRNHRSPYSSRGGSEASLSPASSVEQMEETTTRTTPTPNVINENINGNNMVTQTPTKTPTKATTTPTKVQILQVTKLPATRPILQQQPTQQQTQQLTQERASVLRVHVLPPTTAAAQMPNNNNMKSITTTTAKATTLPTKIVTTTQLPATTIIQEQQQPLQQQQLQMQQQQQQVCVLKRTLCDAQIPAKRISLICNGTNNNNNNTNGIIQHITNNTTATTIPATTTTNDNNPIVLQRVINTSLHDLDISLQSIGHDTRTLYQQQQQQRARAGVTGNGKFEQKLDAIIVEHKKQEEILGNIKTAYDVHIQQQQQQQLPITLQQQLILQQQQQPPRQYQIHVQHKQQQQRQQQQRQQQQQQQLQLQMQLQTQQQQQ